MLAYVSLSKLWMNIFQAMTLFREANISFNHILTHSTIKYVKRRAPNRSSLNGRLRRKVPTVSGTNGHFHYCCAIFTNNKFHTLNMSLCVKGFDGAFAFFSLAHAIPPFVPSRFPSPRTFLCPLLVLKFIIFHSPCLCRILFGRKTRFAFHFALLFSADEFFMSCRTARRPGVTRETLNQPSKASRRHERREAAEKAREWWKGYKQQWLDRNVLCSAI